MSLHELFFYNKFFYYIYVIILNRWLYENKLMKPPLENDLDSVYSYQDARFYTRNKEEKRRTFPRAPLFAFATGIVTVTTADKVILDIG